MRVLLKDHPIVLIPESADEKSELDGWRATLHATHVFCADSDPHALTPHGLGKRAMPAVSPSM